MNRGIWRSVVRHGGVDMKAARLAPALRGVTVFIVV